MILFLWRAGGNLYILADTVGDKFYRPAVLEKKEHL
jgi:hypothetical protein